MVQISIGDLTGSAQIDVSDNSTLAGKSQLTALTTAASQVFASLPKPVGDPTFKDASFAAAFDNPSIALKGNTLGIKASVNSTVTVARDSDSPLFGSDDYDPINIKAGECWVSFELDTLLDGSIAVPLPDGFGVSFEKSNAPDFTTYSLIPASRSASTTLQQAIAQVLDAFQIVDSADDVLAIPEGIIYISDISGSVKVGGSWTLPLAVNQLSLADAKLPFNASISVNPALTLGVSGDISITSEFSVRFRLAARNLVRIGIYKKKGVTFDVSFTASAGLSATSGNTDLINEFFQAVAPGIDANQLQPADAANIQQVLNDSIDRSLAISLNTAWSDAISDAAALVYELDISAGDQATKNAIDAALTGDWTALTALPNARKIRNVFTESTERKMAFTVNILGLCNYRSVLDFVSSMQVVSNSQEGSVVITDTATAKLITTASTPLAADPDRLRDALYEAFVATATYQALAAGAGFAAVFSATQNFLLYGDSVNYRQALTQLNAGEVLGVMPPAVKTALPGAGSPVKHARFAASCSYGNEDVLRFFFSDVTALTPRLSGDLEKIGRKVLAQLLDAQDPIDQKRIVVLNDDALWAMQSDPQTPISPSYSDYMDVSKWAATIAKVGPVLSNTIAFAKTVQGDPTANPVFLKKRGALALALDGATHNVKMAFKQNENFPICAMATLAGLTPGANPPIFQASWDGKTIFSNQSAPQLAVAKSL